jgi:DNA polymerase delta subunit 1
MATARVPQKRILGESTNARRNIPSSPASAKKRKLEPISSPAARFKTSQNGPRGNMGSSQPSHFESEVLEKMTQDMAGLKKHNSEKDQAWARPPLDDFNVQTDNLCFQQIEAEEGTLHGGKTTVKLFGVTEVGLLFIQNRHLLICSRPVIPLCFMLPTSFIISMLRLQFHLVLMIVKASKSTSTPR